MLTQEEKLAAAKTIRECDKLFDGFYANGVHHRDREGAYNKLRNLARTLLAKDDI